MTTFNSKNLFSLVDFFTDQLKGGDETVVDDLHVIHDRIKNCFDYVKAVDDLQNYVVCFRQALDPEDYQAGLAQKQFTRASAFNCLEHAVRELNRVAAEHGINKIFAGDPEVRRSVEGFAKEVTFTFFENGQELPF